MLSKLYDTIKKNIEVRSENMSKYTENDLKKIVYDALQCFREKMDFRISSENTALTFSAPDNGIDMYEAFCKRYFYVWL